MDSRMKKVLLIDAYNMIHRSRFGWSKGDHAITYTFFRSLKSEISRHEPDKVYIVSEGMPKHRLEINKDYKGDRKVIKDPGFHRQKKEIFETCKMLPLTIIRHPNYECDDVIGHLATKVHANDKVVICSSDSDFIQLLEKDNVSLWNPVKKSFVEKWPVNYLVWKSLRGDKTDNVPGIKGVGDKTAMKLASSPELLEQFLTPEKRKIYESALLQITLSDLSNDGNKLESNDYTFDREKLFSSFEEFSFSSITQKSWNKWLKIMEPLNEKSNPHR